MPEIAPFRGILYHPGRVDLAAVVTPPYDVITPADRDIYERRDAHNIIRIELAKGLPSDDGARESPYSRAAACLCDWLAKGVLTQDPLPAIYPYAFTSSGPAGALTGFVAMMRVEPCTPGRVMPHEDTFAVPKEDRMRLLATCRANTSLIVGLVPDAADEVFGMVRDAARRAPARLTVADDDGVHHRVWAMTDPAVIVRLQGAMQARPIYIADGHHRYEAALAYSQSPAGRAEPAAGFVMILFLRMEDPALTILPTHRVVHGLPDFAPAPFRQRLAGAFAVERLPGGLAKAALDRLRERLRAAWDGRRPAFGLLLAGEKGYDVLAPRPGAGAGDRASASGRPAAWAQLDVAVFQRLVLEEVLGGPGNFADRAAHLLYTKSDEEAVGHVRDGTAQAAFLLNPTRIEQLKAVVEAGERMPHKSTYFYPKPLTGLVLRAWGPGLG